jgi:hypothetical protein
VPVDGGQGGRGSIQVVRGLAEYFRANPQVFLLVVICVLLGLGTFIAVLVALVTAGQNGPTGEPSGTILAARALLAPGAFG